MSYRLSRRELLRLAGASGMAAGLGGTLAARSLLADPPNEKGFIGGVISPSVTQPTTSCPSVVGGKVVQPQRELTLLDQTDVLVVGAGPAGVAAAIAAKRAGAQVTLVERYNHFGGLWTGGLVLVVLGHMVKGKKQVCMGIGEEMMQHLDKIDGGIVNRKPGVNPTVDAEALKFVMLDMIEEAGVKVFLHCWGVDAILDGNTVCGAVFESKSGRQAILAKQVIDATGDGDVFAAAGAEYTHFRYQIGLCSRIGYLDKVDPALLNQKPKPRGLGMISPMPGVNWIGMRGPDGDALDVKELTRLEMSHRRFIWESMQKMRSTAGFEPVRLVETAPQMGVRMSRSVAALKPVTFQDFKAQTRFPDVVAVGGAWSGEHDEWQIPFGALVPKKIDNILASGRCIATDLKMVDLVRVIPICFVTGHAAGVASAVAVKDGCKVRDVEVPKVQRILREQDAYLG